MFCFWCQPGDVPKNLEEKGFVWIHLECLMELSNFKDDLENLKKILHGSKHESVESYLKRMQDFDHKSKKIMNLVKNME